MFCYVYININYKHRADLSHTFANEERDLCPFPRVILAHCEDAAPAIGDRVAYRAAGKFKTEFLIKRSG